jgi:Ner family transcriptional regulator
MGLNRVDFTPSKLRIVDMSTIKTTPVQEDMHPADVIAALHKRGTSLRKIAQENGYSHIQRVLTHRWLAAEQLVAKALDTSPQALWPSRYLDPLDRALAFRQTRKIAVTMPQPWPDTAQAATDGSAAPQARVKN